MPSLGVGGRVFLKIYQIAKSYIVYTNWFPKIIWKSRLLIILRITSKVIAKVICVWKISNQQTVEPDEAIEEDVPDSPGIEKHDKEKDHKDLKKSRCKFSFPVLLVV